eukprot:7384548-Prymnesium_polylepis.2
MSRMRGCPVVCCHVRGLANRRSLPAEVVAVWSTWTVSTRAKGSSRGEKTKYPVLGANSHFSEFVSSSRGEQNLVS